MRSILAVTSIAIIALAGCADHSPTKPQLARDMPAPSVMAMDAEMQGNWTDAARHWEQAAAAAPDDRAIALHTVRALRLASACGRASTYLERLFKNGAESADVFLETGKCHLVSGRYQAAEAALTAALAANPASWEAETVLGTVYDLMDQPDAARPHHERAAQLAPHNAMVLSNAALSRALAGDLHGALDLMRRAAAEPGAPARVRMNLAFLEAVSGNGDVAGMMARQEAGTDLENVKLLKRIAGTVHRAESS
jgi:Flp pilus assembly protein TadD